MTKAEIAARLYKSFFVPHFFGILVGTLLSGIIIAQLAVYFTSNPSSNSGRQLERYAVASIVIFGTGLLALDWGSLYLMSWSHAADPMWPYVWHLNDFLQPPVAVMLSAGPQIWFLERAYRIAGRNKWLALVNFLPILLEVGVGWTLLAVGVTHGHDPNYFILLGVLVVVWMWAGSVADFISSAVLCWKVRDLLLLSASPQTKRSPVVSLIRMSLLTGALTTVIAFIGGILYERMWRVSNCWIVFVLSASRLSAISCLLCINSESKYRFGYTQNLGVPGVGVDKGLQTTLYSHTSSPRQAQEFKIDLAGRAIGILGKHDRPLALAKRDDLEAGHHVPIPHARVSEIGSVGDLDRALRDFQRPEVSCGIFPALESFSIGTVEVVPQSPGSPRPKLSKHQRRSSGILVATSVTKKVEDRRASVVSV
ncbi:hypothetical protein T439DRAFT_326671 [Meredithblackwellia eburnea MCA 4105]